MIAKDVLVDLGYSLYTDCNSHELLAPEAISSYDIENKLAKESMQRENAEDYNSREGQRQVLANATNRIASQVNVL